MISQTILQIGVTPQQTLQVTTDRTLMLLIQLRRTYSLNLDNVTKDL